MRVAIHPGGHPLAAARRAVSAGGGEAVELPLPDRKSGWASAAGEALLAAERALAGERLDAVVVGGDDSRSLAAALAASRAGLPVIRLDAGDRSPAESPAADLADRLADLVVCANPERRRAVLAIGIDPDRVHPDLPAALAALGGGRAVG